MLIRLAIEEVEAWYLGDQRALRTGFPKVKFRALENYRQDSICGTWELLADCVHPGGAKALESAGYPVIGKTKCDWAKTIGPLLDPEQNQSPSFRKLRDGLRRLAAEFEQSEPS